MGMEGGMWKSKVTIDNNNRMPKPFLDIEVESDRKTKLHVLFNFEEDNKWELKVDRVPGQKMTIEAVIDGQKWTGEGNLNHAEGLHHGRNCCEVQEPELRFHAAEG